MSTEAPGLSEQALVADISSKTAKIRRLSNDLHKARADLHDALVVYQANHEETIAESEGIAQRLRQAQNVRRKRKAPLALIGIEAPPVVTAPSTEATATIPAKSKATAATPPSTEATTTTTATSPNTKS